METRLRPPDNPQFRLIETCLWQPGHGVVRRDLHLARVLASAKRLGISPVEDLTALLDGINGRAALRARLTLDGQGQAEIMTTPIEGPPPTSWRVGLAETVLDETNPWRGIKSTERELYDTARAALPDELDEVVFLNRQGRFADGTITNLFVDLGEGLMTPQLSDGALPGVLRASLLARGLAREAPLTPADLSRASRIFIGNSLRGLIPAHWQP